MYTFNSIQLLFYQFFFFFFLLIFDSVERDYHGKSTADRIKVEVHYFKPNHGLKYVKKTLLKKKKKTKATNYVTNLFTNC